MAFRAITGIGGHVDCMVEVGNWSEDVVVVVVGNSTAWVMWFLAPVSFSVFVLLTLLLSVWVWLFFFFFFCFFLYANNLHLLRRAVGNSDV